MKLQVHIINDEMIEFSEELTIFGVKLSTIKELDDTKFFIENLINKEFLTLKLDNNEFLIIPKTSIKFYKFID